MAKVASLSGKSGESYILAILNSPRPFLKEILVVEACATMLPPIGFLGSAYIDTLLAQDEGDF